MTGVEVFIEEVFAGFAKALLSCAATAWLAEVTGFKIFIREDFAGIAVALLSSSEAAEVLAERVDRVLVMTR